MITSGSSEPNRTRAKPDVITASTASAIVRAARQILSILGQVDANKHDFLETPRCQLLPFHAMLSMGLLRGATWPLGMIQ